MSDIKCDICQSLFPTQRGMKIHRAACSRKHPTQAAQPEQPVVQPDPDPPPQPQNSTTNHQKHLPDLPGFVPANPLPAKAMNTILRDQNL